jgi:two-component system, OmpR family, response regulator ChvI
MREGYGYRPGSGLEQKLVTDTKRIMLIDDNRDIGLSFRIVLEHYYESNLKVDSFTDPLTALDNFETGLYDLVMIDTVMPGMNGFEVYRRLKELDSKVMVCFLVPGVLYEDATRRLFPELDESNFIQIPVANEALVRKVGQVLSHLSQSL